MTAQKARKCPPPELRILVGDETAPIEQKLFMLTNLGEFLADRERLARVEARATLRMEDDRVSAFYIWDLPSTPHLHLAELAKIERTIAARVSLSREANAMHWVYMRGALNAYRRGAQAFYAGDITREDLEAIGARLSQAQKDTICFQESRLGAA